MMTWIQRTITIKGKSQGCHLITDSITSQVPELKRIKVGMAHLFLQHTSASLTLNENADPDVRADMDRVLKHIVPAPSQQIIKYQHLDEGDDDMPAHAMCSLLGAGLMVQLASCANSGQRR
ncbi:hypothetical protein MP228_012367 [Amoeboaphelidium protococcarum]|nr:hypothetical protein MP228_012367 [Amoeboaphelidium protococcarum]